MDHWLYKGESLYSLKMKCIIIKCCSILGVDVNAGEIDLNKSFNKKQNCLL